jgi:hypothetical protein
MKYKDTRAPVGSLDVAAPGGLVPHLSRFAFRRLRALEAENYKQDHLTTSVHLPSFITLHESS